MSKHTYKIASFSWWFFCAAFCAVSVAVESIPFLGMEGVWAGGARPAIRIAFFTIPLMISLLVWAFCVARKVITYRYTPWHWALALLGAIAGMSVLFASDWRVALFGSSISEQGALTYVVLLIAVFLGSQHITNESRLSQLSWVVVLVGSFVGSLAILEVLGLRIFAILGEPWMYSRGMSTLMNPDFLGGFLVIPCTLSAVLSMLETSWKKIGALACFAVTFSSLVLSQTRGAWIGLAVALVILIVSYTYSKHQVSQRSSDALLKKAGILGALSVLIVLAAVLLLPHGTTYITRITQIFSDFSTWENGFGGRIGIWKEVWPVIANHPLLGVGADSLGLAWQQYAGMYTLNSIGSSVLITSSHSLYIDFAVFFGIPFALLFMSMYFGSAYSAQKSAMRENIESRYSTIVLGWVAAVVGMGVALGSAITNMPLMALAFLGVGVLMSTTVSLERKTPRYGVVLIVVAAFAMGSLLLLFGVFELRSAVAGNVNTGNAGLRLNRALNAHDIAPWRPGPVEEMMTAVSAGASFGDAGIDSEPILNLIEARAGNSSIALYNLGDYYLQSLGNAQKALELAEKAVQARPLFVPGIMLRADALAALGEGGQAEKLYEQAVVLESGVNASWAWSAPWIAYLDFLNRTGDMSKLDKVVEQFSMRFPDNAATGYYKQGLTP